MSKSKFTPIEVVERAHKKYLEYEQAFLKQPFSEDDLQKQLMEIVEKDGDFDSPEFENTVVELMLEKPAKRVDVNNTATKFSNYVEMYLLTNEEPLPENIQKDYDKLPIKESQKPFYSIENGKFVKNEDVPMTIEKENLKVIYRQLKEQV